MPREALEAVLRCGLAAPSSKNARPWRLHVIQDEGLRTLIADAAAAAPDADTYVPRDPATGKPYPYWTSSVGESADALRAAPAAIVLENRGVFSGGLQRIREASDESLRNSVISYGLETMGLGTALENMWIAASALGLGAAFLGDLGIVSDTIRDLLTIEGDVVGVMALGYPTGQPFPRREPPAFTQVGAPVVWHGEAGDHG